MELYLATRNGVWLAYHPDISDLEFAGTEPRNMVERFVHADDQLFDVMSNGALWHAPLPTQTWSEILPPATKIEAACQMGD